MLLTISILKQKKGGKAAEMHNMQRVCKNAKEWGGWGRIQSCQEKWSCEIFKILWKFPTL